MSIWRFNWRRWRGAAAVLLAAAWLPAWPGELKDIPRGFKLVDQDNCGVKEQSSNLLFGVSFAIPESNRPALKLKDERLYTAAHSTPGGVPIYRTANMVLLRYTGLFPEARYAVRAFFYNADTNECVQIPLANGCPLATEPIRLPPGQPVTKVFEVPPEVYRRDATLEIEFRLQAGPHSQASAVELWSDRAELMEGRRGFHMRCRVDAMPPDGKPFRIGHHWGTVATISNTGLTPWITNAIFLMQISGIHTSAAGASLFSSFVPKDPQREVEYQRQIPWNVETPGQQHILGVHHLDSTRDLARFYYKMTLAQVGDQLWPLARPPLLFGNCWGHTWGPRNEYHLKTLRLLGLNCVMIEGDKPKYARLYGWSAPRDDRDRVPQLPFNETEFRASQEKIFTTNFFADNGPELAIYRLVEMGYEFGFKPDDPAAEAGFRRWLAAQKVAPREAGARSLDEAKLLLTLKEDDTPQNRRRYYWSRRYRAWLTPKSTAMTAEAIRRVAPNPNIQCYFGIGGHAMFLSRERETVNPMPLDLFELSGYPGVMPAFGDWMSPNYLFPKRDNNRFLTHETVAYVGALFNSGARRYGAEFGQPPRSHSMLITVHPSLFRAYTALGNQMKYIAYYNYGPRIYVYAEGGPNRESWSGIPVAHQVIGQVNNQAALVDDLLGPGTLLPSRVALLYARSTEYLAYIAGSADPICTTRRGLFLGLSHAYYKPDVVTEEQIAAGALEHYDALYVADPWVSAAAQEAMAAWVKKGGLLWACDGALRFNEYGEPRDLLAAAAGLKRSWITMAERTNLAALARSASNAPAGELQMVPVPGEADFEPHPVVSARHEGQPIGPRFPPWKPLVSGRSWGCREAEWPGARVRARYSDGAPAWLENKLDKGRVVYVLHDVGVDYSLWRDPQLESDLTFWNHAGAAANRAVLTAPLREAKVPRPLEVSVPALMASPVGTEAGTVVVLYNMIAATNENVVFTVKAPGKPHSVQVIRGRSREPKPWPFPLSNFPLGERVLPSGTGAPEDLPYEYADGAVKMTLPKLPDPGDGWLLVVRHTPPPPDPRLEEMRKNAVANLASDDWETLSAGAWFAGFYPDWGLGAKLVPLLKHPHWTVRRSAAEGLGRMKFAAASGELRKAIDGEKDAHVLADMLIALDRLAHPDVPALAKKLVLHDNPWVYNEAAAILLRR